MKTLKAFLLSLIPTLSFAGVHIQQGDNATLGYVQVSSLTCSGTPCGSSSSGGSSALQVTSNGVQVTSPTPSMNFGTQFTLAAVGSTSTVALNSNLVVSTITAASMTVTGPFNTVGNTVLGNASAQVFIPSVGSLTPSLQFLRQPTGGAITATDIRVSDLPFLTTTYIQNTSALQSGATFYVSSATVNGALNLPTLSNTILAVNSVGLVISTTVSGSGTNLLPSSSTYTGQNVWTTPAQSTFTYGLAAGSMTITGSGDSRIQFTYGSSTYSVTSSSVVPITGDFVKWSSTNGTFMDGGSSAGGGTPGGSNNQVQYNSASSFAGSNNFQFNGTSVTIIGSVTVTDTQGLQNGNAFLDVYRNSANSSQALLSVGSVNQANQFRILDQQPTDMSIFGATLGALKVGTSAGHLIFDSNASANQINLWNTSGMVLQTANVGDGGTSSNSILLRPSELTQVTISSLSVAIATITTITSSGTSSALNITANGVYGVTNGSSGGLFMNCTGGGSTSGMCAQLYSNAGAQTAFGGMLNIVNDNAAYNEPAIYTQRTNNTQNNSDIRVDATGTPAITLVETAQTNASAGKFQLSVHNGDLRIEGRNAANTAFDSAIVISSMASFGDVALGQGYNFANSAQLQVISSTSNIYTAYFSTASTGGRTIAISTQSEILLGGSAGTNGQLLTSAGVGAIPTWTTVSAGGGGYALQPATVTIAAAQGVTISSVITVSIPSGVVGTTSTITSTMSVILASAPASTGWITLTLPSAASFPGIDIMVYKVDSTTNSIRIQAAGTDLIESTGTVFLNAIYQHASLHSLGSAGWGSGMGEIQYTPPYLGYPDGHDTNTIGASSNVVVCPVYLNVPAAVTAYELYNAAGAANVVMGLMDRWGNVVSSTGPVADGGFGAHIFTMATPTNIPPGQYYLAFQASNNVAQYGGTSINGGNGGLLCSAKSSATMGLPNPYGFPGSQTARFFTIKALLNGARQTE